ncbi:hypothetical protein P2R12_23240 [Cytobacillus oceanisediminis]|uniref:hypothetical protein n=1 Tax=Cytobacillus oceanisediminis TaxID=665099 RepID=UPI0023DA5C90|nr:hypothetical protein [Cytobacillus oceanisediminis]MDF2039860.1 hypothetical protein [Cytobacillus oceanisediminis]
MTINKYVDLETGEVKTGALVENSENKIIIDKDALLRMKDFQNDKKNYELFQDVAGGFSFMLVETLKELHKDTRFNDMEKARIMFLGTYVSYESSGRYLFTNNNKHLLKADLQELLEITNKKEFYKFYNKLVENGIIEEEVLGRFEIRLKWNSKYHFKGKASGAGTSSTETVKAYDRQIQALYKEKNAKGKSVNTPKNLYVLFMVLSFINIESGALCRNPHNPIEEDAEPLELSGLAEMFGYSRISMLKNKLMNCKLFGTNVFFIGEGMLDRKKYTRIYVNPFVASRSPKAPNPSLLAMFPNTENEIAKRLISQQRINSIYAETRKDREREKKQNV